MNLHLLKGQGCGRGCTATKPEEGSESKVPTLDVPHHAWDQALWPDSCVPALGKGYNWQPSAGRGGSICAFAHHARVTSPWLADGCQNFISVWDLVGRQGRSCSSGLYGCKFNP